MGEFEGIKHILDLEACMDFENAGSNRKKGLFESAKETRTAITRDTFKKLKKFSKPLADEFENSDIEIVDLDETVYSRVEALAQLISTTSAELDAAANEKLQIIALANCAQNGSLPKCAIITGDVGKHGSSMKVLCASIKVTAIEVSSAF